MGRKVGQYEIIDKLGEGGMGEVFLARDSKLDRDVALKILPEVFAADPERLTRFEREAKALAALNHPNIAHVYDAGTSDATSYLAMELVKGDDLSSLIARGPVPLADALPIARQVAEALETAHAAGIVHRDLKPANLKVRPDGTVKVLDFGLAKAVHVPGTARSEDLANSPTMTLSAATMRGVILGTAAYMSPEQARGEVVDRRCDIWAFGVVLFEMLTGRRAFEGQSATDVLSAVIRAEPDWNALPPDVPPAIRALLQGCLTKDRGRRLADISTARFVIEAAPGLAVPATPRTGRRWALGLAASVGALAVLGLVALPALFTRKPAAVARYVVTPSEEQSMVDTTGVDFAISPDGSWMVYVGRAPGGSTRLFRRNLDELDAVPLPGSDGAAAPAVSPDGRSIAFVVAGGSIRTIPADGGPTSTVVQAGGVPAWSDDGHIYFGRGTVTYRVPAQGGEPVAITTPEMNVLQQDHDALPNGRGLLLSLLQGTAAQARIAVVGPEGGSVRTILRGTMARYSTTGHIVYATTNGAVFAAPFDVQRLEVTGPSLPLVEGVAVSTSATSQFAVSRSGALLYGTGIGFVSELMWVNRDGVATAVDPDWKAEFGSPVLSPDGSKVAVAIQGAESMDIWVAQLDRGPRLRLTVDGERNDYPTWSHDGRFVTFTSDRTSPSFDLWSKRSDGSGEPRLEIDEEGAIAEGLWSPDGRWFLHRTSTNLAGAGDILGRRVDGESKPVPIVATRFTEVSPAISPNGRWMAYTTSESGRNEVVVVPFPDSGESKWPVSAAGGTEPVWSRDGNELFYRNGKGELVAVRVETRSAFAVGPATVLFSASDYARWLTHRQYDVSLDGKRFLFLRPIGAGRETRVILVRNALAER